MSLEQKLRDFPSEKLLKMRAEGDTLADEWHRAIEKVFSERNEYLPPIPQAPIVFESKRKPASLSVVVGLLVLLIASNVIAKMLAHAAIGLLLSAGIVVWFVAQYIRRNSLSEGDLQREIEEKKANDDGLNDLMRSAASGDVARVKELLSFKAVDINETSLIGSTALMYAARNGNSEIVELLLLAGADASVKSTKGATAESIAQRFGHASIVERLKQL